MLLVCPKCKANYEIPRHAVPIGGREVKCAACGHSWFQTRTKKSNDDKLIEPQTEIKKGDTVMIVEAMKTMNHVPSTFDGTVKEILVNDGQPVEFGQTLVILK